MLLKLIQHSSKLNVANSGTWMKGLSSEQE